MEHKIGTRITLEVVEQNRCDGCFFFRDDKYFDCSPLACVRGAREDGKSIIYKVIKEE